MFSESSNNYLNEDNQNYITQEDFEKDLRLVNEKLPEKILVSKSKVNFIEDILALYKYLMDSDIKWYRKAIVLAAVLYFISPIDSIPDFAPLVGYLDDLGVIVATIKYLGSEILPYYRSVPSLATDTE